MKDDSEKIILGGGISGLIYSYVNPEYKIITDKIGGQMNESFSLGPRLLHSSYYTKIFIRELNLQNVFFEKKVRVGFFYDGKINSENTDLNREKYFLKTRGNGTVYDSSMSGGKSVYSAFVIDEKILIGRLMSSRIMFDKITNINLEDKTISGRFINQLKFNDVVSTIPRPVFCKLIGDIDESKRYKSHSTTFVKVSSLKGMKGLSDFGEYDYVYFSGKESFHRITKLKDGFCLEFKNEPESILKYEVDRFTLPIGQLIELDDKKEYDNVFFFGRYAKWDHSIKMNDEIEELMIPF